jgi:hypothetical protein
MTDADNMVEEIAKIVGVIHPGVTANEATNTPPAITSALAAITPSANHVAKSRALGLEPAAHIGVIRQHIADTVSVMKQFVATMPADDPNAAKINDLIARLH